MKFLWFSLVLAVAVAAMSGCGDDLAAQAKKAAQEVAAEAKKTAAAGIEAGKNAATDQLKQIRKDGDGEKDNDGGSKSSKEK